MALDRLAVGISLVAVAAAGYAAWTTCGLSHDLRTEQDRSALLAQRLSDAETALAAAKTAAATAPPPLAAPVAPAGLAGRTAGATPAAADVESRLAALEKTEAEFRKILADPGIVLPDGKEVAGAVARALPQGADAPMHFDLPTIYGSSDDAAKHLELSPSQKAEFERASADAKREMEDLKKIPDETGKTWNDVSKDTFKVGDGGVFSFDTSKLREFREKTVPGRSESFGGAEKRIRDSAKSRMRSVLTADQQSKYDKAMVDPMLGTSGGGDFGMVISSVEMAVPERTPPGK